MAQYDGSIRINTSIDTNGIRRGESDIRGSMSRISNSAKKLAGIIGAAFAIGKIAQFGKEALQLASDFEAMGAQFSQVFGELESTASKSLSKISEQTGIVEERMKSSYTKIAAFAKTTGMDAASSMELANRAMVTVADSAAFYDRSLEETTESLQSFLKGNYENDAALGLSATEFTRNAAANKLYGKSFIELSEAQKQLTLLTMVEDANKLSGAMGQAAREADTWTNQTGNLNQAWKNLKANLGKIILPGAIQAVKAITNVINSINAMIERLSVAAGAFRSFSELITGNKFSGGSIGQTAESASGYEEAAASAESLADATNDVADATNKAKKANDGYLSGLDEVRRYDDRDKDEGTSGIGGISSGIGQDIDYGNLAEGETIIEKIGNSLSEVINRVKELAGIFKQGFFEGLGDYKPRLEDLKKDLISIGQTLKEIFTDPGVLAAANRFADQLSYSLGQVVGSVARIGLTIAQLLVGGIEKYLTQNKERIKQYIIGMFNIGTEIAVIIGDFSVVFSDIFSVFGGDIAQQIAGNLIGIFAEVSMMISENATKLGRDILNMITQPIIDNKDKIKDAIEGTLESIEPFTSGLLEAVQKVRDAVSEIYDEHLKPLFDSIADGLSEILGKLLDGYNTYIVPVLQGLGDKFKEIMEGPFGEAIDKAKDLIGKLIDAVNLLWENVLVPFFSWIADNIMPVLEPIADFIGSTVLSVLDTIIDIIGNIAESLGGVIDFVVGVFTGDWEKAWDGIKSYFKGTWDTVSDIISMNLEFVKTVVKDGVELVKALIVAAWESIKTHTLIIWNAINGVLTTILNGLGALASTVSDLIKSAILTAWNVIRTTTSTVWNGIKSTVTGLWNGLKSSASKAFNGIKDTVVKVWEKIKSSTTNIWNGIKIAIKSPINAIIGFINSMISGITNGMNALIRMLNKFSINIPDNPITGAVSLGVNIPELSAVKIPALATGAVIPPNKEFLAVLGDQKHGTNIEAPLSTIEEASERAIEKVLNRMYPQNQKNITYNFTGQINRRVLFEEIIKQAEIEQMVTGRNPFGLA